MAVSEFSDVFVSYRRKNVEFVKQLVDELFNSGLEVWVDWEDIPPGSAEFSDDIKHGIEGADTFIAVLSPEYLESTYCMDLELGYALELNKKIIPLVYEKFEDMQIPDGVGHINWIYFTEHAGQENTFEEAFPRVMEAIQSDLEHTRQHKRFLLRALDWDQSQRGNSYLLQGDELRDAEAWRTQAGGKEPGLTQLHREFIQASRQRQQRNQRLMLASVSVALVVSIILTIIAAVSSVRAGRNADAAATAAREAEIQQEHAISAANNAATQQSIAEENEEQAQENLLAAWEIQSRFLAEVSNQMLEEGAPVESLLLAQESLIHYPTIAPEESLNALTDALNSSVQEQVYFQHDDTINGVFWHDEIRIILSWSDDYTLRLWDGDTGAEVHRMLHAGPVTGAIWGDTVDSQNRLPILSWSEDGTIRLWNSVTGTEIRVMRHDKAVNGAVWNQEQNRILSWSDDYTLRLWNSETGQELLRFYHETEIIGALWSADERRALSWSSDGRIRSWDMIQGEELALIQHAGEVNGALWNQNQRRILSWSDDHTVRLWNADTGQELARLEHGASVLGAIWNPENENRVLSWSRDGGVSVWDTNSGRQELFVTHRESVLGAQWSPNADYILSWSLDNTVRVWDTRDGTEAAQFLHEGKVNGARWIEDTMDNQPFDVAILSFSRDQTVQLWDFHTRQRIQKMTHTRSVLDAQWIPSRGSILTHTGSSGRLWSLGIENRGSFAVFELDEFSSFSEVDWSYDRSRVLLSDGSYTAAILDVGGSSELITLPHEFEIWEVIWSYDDSQILTRDSGNSVRVWDAETGDLLRVLNHANSVWGMQWSRDNQHILVWTEDVIRIWDASTGEEGILLRTEPEISNLGVVWSADESRILSWDSAGMVHVWDAQSGAKFVSLPHESSVSNAAWSADESRILTWVEGTAYVWDVETGEQLNSITTEYIPTALWNADGARVLIDANSFVLLWDSISNDILATIEDLSVQDFQWSPSNEQFLTVDYSNVLTIWDGQTGEQLDRLSFESNFMRVAWHPDSRRILLQVVGDIILWDLDQSQTEHLLTGFFSNEVAWDTELQQILGYYENRVFVHYKTIEDQLELALNRVTRDLANEQRIEFALPIQQPTETAVPPQLTPLPTLTPSPEGSPSHTPVPTVTNSPVPTEIPTATPIPTLTPSSRRKIQLGDLVQGNLRVQDTNEWVFYADAGQPIVIVLRAVEEGSLDTILTLFDEAGNYVDSNDDYEGLNSQIGPITIPDSGNYRIIASGFGETFGDYELLLLDHELPTPTVIATETEVPTETLMPTLTPVFSGQISLRDVVQDEIIPFGRDSWTFEGRAGQTILITMEGVGEEGLDTYLELYAPDGSLLVDNDDRSVGIRDSRIGPLALPVDGTYTIFALGYSATYGSYTLAINESGTATPTITPLPTLTPSGG